MASSTKKPKNNSGTTSFKKRYESSEDRLYKRPAKKPRTTPGTGRGTRSEITPHFRKEIDQRKIFDEKAKPFKRLLDSSIVQKPLCGESPSKMVRAPKYHALREKYIEINTQGRTSVIVIDADHNDIHRYKDDMLPEPNYIVINRATGRHHIAYILQDPVSHGETSRDKPQKFLKHVRNLLNVAYDGDMNYVNRITRNPCAHTKEYSSLLIRERPYSLNYLYKTLLDTMPDQKIQMAKSCAAKSSVKLTQETGSRNCDIFNYVRKKAYVAVSQFNNFSVFSQFISSLCVNSNPSEKPLKISEITQIGKSISKWVWKRRDHLCDNEAVAIQPDNYSELTANERRAVMKHRCWQIRKKQHVTKLINFLKKDPMASLADCARHLNISKGTAFLYKKYATLVMIGIKTLEKLFGDYEKQTIKPQKKRKKYSLRARIARAAYRLALLTIECINPPPDSSPQEN